MQNPWCHFTPEFPYLLPEDYQPVMAFNKTAEEVHKIHYELLPEPYLGRPDAPIFLLNLNPGYSELDLPFYEKEQVVEMWRRNIRHEPLDYPFYLLEPSIAAESGPQWWEKKLKALIQRVGRRTVANQVCCIEYFPYHSKNFQPNKEILASQRYSFHLVAQAMARQVPMVLMRGEKLWLNAVPQLDGYPYLLRLNSAQNVVISRNNCPVGFPILEKVLTEGKINE